MLLTPAFVPPLDPGFAPASLWNRAYLERCATDSGAHPLAIALERIDGTVSRYDTQVLPHEGANIPLNTTYVERLVKTLLWARGGWRLMIAGDDSIAAMLREVYSEAGARAFDWEFMGRRVYGRDLVVETRAMHDMPAAHEISVPLGRHLDGCRIGFDLGGSDRKCAAVIDGKVVFSEEVGVGSLFRERSRSITSTASRTRSGAPRRFCRASMRSAAAPRVCM